MQMMPMISWTHGFASADFAADGDVRLDDVFIGLFFSQVAFTECHNRTIPSTPTQAPDGADVEPALARTPKNLRISQS